MIFTALRFAFSRMGLYSLCGIVVLAFVGWYSLHERSIGAAGITTEINIENQGAKNDADRAESDIRRHYNECAADPHRLRDWRGSECQRR